MHALELSVIGSAAGRVDETSRYARDQQLILNVKLYDGIKLLFAVRKHAVKLLSLRNGSGKAV